MFSNISVAKKIGILSLLTLISLATIAIVNLVFLTSLILMFENSDRAVRLCPVKC